MGQVRYNNKRIIPAPFVSFSKQIQATSDGSKVGTLYNITIGTDLNPLVSFKGSPNSSGVFYEGDDYPPDEEVPADSRLAALERKIEALRQLFSVDGLRLEWQSDDETTPLYCHPRIKSMDFPAEVWFDKADYSVTMEADVIYGLNSLSDERFAQYISSATDSWEIQERDEPGVYSLLHNISAVGKKFYAPSGSSSGLAPSGAFEYARLYVNSNLGYDSQRVTQSLLGSGAINFGLLHPYNYSRIETINETEGTFGITESWVLSNTHYFETYTAQVGRLDEPTHTATVSLQGTIQGLYTQLGDKAVAINAAQSGWTVIKPLLPGRAWALVSGASFTQGNYTLDYSQGILSYQFDYNNAPVSGNSLATFTVQNQFGYDQYRTTSTIEGQVLGILGPDEYDLGLKFQRARSRWDAFKGQLYGLAVFYSSGISNLKSIPVSKNVTEDPFGGLIQFSYTFDNRTDPLFSDEYSANSSFSTDAGFTTINIQGTVQGYGFSGAGNFNERFLNASGALPTESGIYARATGLFPNLTFSNNPISKEYILDPAAGTASYNFGYRAGYLTCVSGALSEVISVVETHPGSIIPIIPVIGRAAGPILQDLGTFTERVRDINIELVLPATGTCNYLNAFNTKPDTNFIVSGLKPSGIQVYKVRDQETYSWSQGRYTRTTTFLWER